MLSNMLSNGYVLASGFMVVFFMVGFMVLMVLYNRTLRPVPFPGSLVAL